MLERRSAYRAVFQPIARAGERIFEVDLMLSTGRARGFWPIRKHRTGALVKRRVEIRLGSLHEHGHLTIAIEQPSAIPNGVTTKLQHVVPSTNNGKGWGTRDVRFWCTAVNQGKLLGQCMDIFAQTAVWVYSRGYALTVELRYRYTLAFERP